MGSASNARIFDHRAMEPRMMPPNRTWLIGWMEKLGDCGYLSQHARHVTTPHSPPTSLLPTGAIYHAVNLDLRVTCGFMGRFFFFVTAGIKQTPRLRIGLLNIPLPFSPVLTI